MIWPLKVPQSCRLAPAGYGEGGVLLLEVLHFGPQMEVLSQAPIGQEEIQIGSKASGRGQLLVGCGLTQLASQHRDVQLSENQSRPSLDMMEGC